MPDSRVVLVNGDYPSLAASAVATTTLSVETPVDMPEFSKRNWTVTNDELIQIVDASQYPEIVFLMREGAIDSAFSAMEKVELPEPMNQLAYHAMRCFENLYTQVKAGNVRTEVIVDSSWSIPSGFASELIRFYFALSIGITDQSCLKAVGSGISRALDKCVDEIVRLAGNYPHEPIKAEVWQAGSELRELLELLAARFKACDNERGETFSRYQKAKVTNSIMSHYPALWCPDMISAGKAMELVGELERAKSFYGLIVRNTYCVLDHYITNEDGTAEGDEDRVAMECLLEAFRGLTRLESEENLEHLEGHIDQLRSILARKGS